jgi:hypothetical protein
MPQVLSPNSDTTFNLVMTCLTRKKGAFLEELYLKRFGKERPEVVWSIEERVQLDESVTGGTDLDY